MHWSHRSLLAALCLLALPFAACVSVAQPDGWAAIAHDETTIYVFPAKDRLEARDPATGQVRWRFPDKNKPDQKDVKFEAVYDDPIIDGDALIFGSHDGKLVSLNRADGSIRWIKDDISGGITGGPLLIDGLLVFGTDTAHLYARKAADGAAAPGWPQNGLKTREQVWAAPVAGLNGTVILATVRGDVAAYRLSDASIAWGAPFEADGAVADLGVAGDAVFVPTLRKGVHLVDPATGKPKQAEFRAGDWVWTTPAVVDGVAYFGDFSGDVYALDLATNRNRWAASYDANAKIKSPPVVIGDVLVVASREPAVHFINVRDGARLNVVPIPGVGTIRAPLSVRDGKAWIVTTDGDVLIADPVTRSVNPAPGSGTR